MQIVNIIAWLLNAFMVWSLFYSIKLRKRTVKITKELRDSYAKTIIQINKSITEIIERQNHLSKENSKLVEENQRLKERLRNMGITYFD